MCYSGWFNGGGGGALSWATIIHRVFEANSSFRVKWSTTGKV